MKQRKTWVLVANGRIARFFDWPGRNAPLVPVEGHVLSATEVHDYSDSQGMSHSRMGHSQHRMAPKTEPEDLTLDAFAREIGEHLLSALQDGAFDRLVVTAAPRLMGYLRAHLDTAVQATVWIEIDKDFSHLPLDDLNTVLEPHLFP